MSGVRPRLSHVGPNTYTVSEAVRGGQLVEGFTDGKARLTRVGSMNCLGVAEIDAKPFVSQVGAVDADGFPILSVDQLPTETVAGWGRYVVNFTANCAFGQALSAAANGAVTPIAADGDPRLVVGYCDEPNGVVFATNPTGLANISR